MDERGDAEKVVVVQGHDRCQTYDAKWLCLENVYQKLYRPNMYDIGGTYIGDVADFWFMHVTDRLGDLFLLHLFVCNRSESSFQIGLSYDNNLTIDKKTDNIYLSDYHKTYRFTSLPENSYTYVTSYNFSELDVECLKNKKLNISIKFFSDSAKGLSQDVLDEVKSGHDFSALLEDPICSDFTIESSDGNKFRVHKVILAAHSDVFKAMLKEETAESQNNYVKLVDVYGDDLRCILQFIYTGTVKDVMECNCSNLLMLADKYDLRGLVLLVEHALVQQITVDTAAEILMIADLYNSDFLKDVVMKFIKKNTGVLKTSAWAEVSAPLVREVCNYLVPSDE